MRHLWRVALAMLVGCPGQATQPSTTPPLKLTQGQLDAERMLAPAIQAAQDAGAERFLAVGAAALDEGEQLGSFVELAEGECLLGMARAGDSVRDVDLFVYADDGDRLAADEAPTATAAVLVCPPHPDRVYVVTRNVSGSGVVALGVMRVAPNQADAVASVLEVRGRPGEDTGKLEAWPGLERKIRQRRANLGAHWEDVRRVAVPVDPHAATTVSTRIKASECIDVLVVPSEEVASVELLVMGADGRVVARGRPPGRDRSAVVCSGIEQDLTIAIRPRASVGLVAVVVSHAGPGALAELREPQGLTGMTPLLPMAAALARHDGKRLSAVGWGEAEEVGKPQVPTQGMVRLPVELSTGCTRLDVVGGAPLAQFEAQLWRRDGVSLARGRGGEVATLYACGKTTTKAELELDAVDRPGPVTVLRRQIDDVPAALTAAPQAAGRLLARFDGLGLGPVSPIRLQGLTSQRLEPGRRGEGKLTLEAGQCVALVAAADGTPQSVSIRLEEGTAVHAQSSGYGVAALEHCSARGGRFRYRLELATAAAAVLTAHKLR